MRFTLKDALRILVRSLIFLALLYIGFSVGYGYIPTDELFKLIIIFGVANVATDMLFPFLNDPPKLPPTWRIWNDRKK